ncbi:hypothetical protein SISNIDRAFT_470892 [Sistotremastrum niveocremeum HHB9708]|uniref:Uncharacterized protein n=1 Tax=Sistotremastrum niveocremeum HHB9708 TaxID=1314777 RepID=A0A164NB24_9AGAM|nr:hypothetical protein SISNIDRAFT_470892 [Sistotremastrum niveocremeum HHB9708]
MSVDVDVDRAYRANQSGPDTEDGPESEDVDPQTSFSFQTDDDDLKLDSCPVLDSEEEEDEEIEPEPEREVKRRKTWYTQDPSEEVPIERRASPLFRVEIPRIQLGGGWKRSLSGLSMPQRGEEDEVGRTGEFQEGGQVETLGGSESDALDTEQVQSQEDDLEDLAMDILEREDNLRTTVSELESQIEENQKIYHKEKHEIIRWKEAQAQAAAVQLRLDLEHRHESIQAALKSVHEKCMKELREELEQERTDMLKRKDEELKVILEKTRSEAKKEFEGEFEAMKLRLTQNWEKEMKDTLAAQKVDITREVQHRIDEALEREKAQEAKTEAAMNALRVIQASLSVIQGLESNLGNAVPMPVLGDYEARSLGLVQDSQGKEEVFISEPAFVPEEDVRVNVVERRRSGGMLWRAFWSYWG